jgi:GAF domain-containing protein
VLITPAARHSAVFEGLVNVLQITPCLFPVALAYAVLRHRVLDIGFALNRTLLYAIMTTLVVGVVSLLDWGVSRIFAEQRWALALEGFITVGFGFTLNWLHAHTEQLLDRVIFRKRHVAERRIEYRIDAMRFAQTTAAVDEAVALDACSILELRSGAAFTKIASAGVFRRTLSTGWEPQTAETIDSDALLVRTLRSLEHPIFLDEVALQPPRFPEGHERPVLAVPIVAQHELIGFALYGNRDDGASPDPEEVALLARLATAAGNAYGAVEARQWRARAEELETLRATPSALPSA